MERSGCSAYSPAYSLPADVSSSAPSPRGERVTGARPLDTRSGRRLESRSSSRVRHRQSERSIMAASIERYNAPGVFDAPTYTQAIKVTGAQSLLFISGQV